MRLKNDLQRLREERDAYRRELMRLGHADILDPQNSLPEDVQQDTSEGMLFPRFPSSLFLRGKVALTLYVQQAFSLVKIPPRIR